MSLILRTALLVCFEIFLVVSQQQPTSGQHDIFQFNTDKPEVTEGAPIKANNNKENFMTEHAEAIQKIISMQEFVNTNPTRQQPKEELQSITTDTDQNPDEPNEGKTKVDLQRCKYYYELFQQKFGELQNQQNHGYKYKDVESGPLRITTESMEPEVAEANKYNVRINNFNTQDLPYPERVFFNSNPDKTIQKPNSKGPIPENLSVFTYNGNQYLPMMDGNYLQPPLESKPVQFKKEPVQFKKEPVQFTQEQQQYMKISPLTLQNYLVSDGKTLYFWYKPLPNYQMYLPITKNGNINKNEERLSDVGEAISVGTSTSSTTTTTESTTPITTPISTTESIMIDKPVIADGIDRNHYEHQLKFIYPIQYPKPDVVNAPTWDIDPYAYYPREFQPDFMNLQIPYVPTFHMIKRLTVPNKYNTEVSIENQTNNS